MNDTTESLRALVLRAALGLAVALVPLTASVTARADAPVELDDAQPEDGDAQPSSSEIAGPDGRSLTWWWWWVPTLK